MDPIYLDFNATAPMLPDVASAIHDCLTSGYANPASQHHAGRRARQVLEEARDVVAQLLGARMADVQADRVIFTSGGTEANNLALRGFIGDRPGRVIVSAVEHPSIVGAAECLERAGCEIIRLPVLPNGVVDLTQLDHLLDKNTRLVSVMLGNNETGALQPVEEVVRICEPYGVPVHTDAVQVVGKLAVDFTSLGVAALSFSAHKFHGPRGIGGLLVRDDIDLQPILYGGFQQLGLRPGTESIALPVGLRRALEIWQADPMRSNRMADLRNRFEAKLRREFPAMVVNAGDAERLPHTSNISFPGIDRQALLMALDLEGVACSTGSACASGSSEPSPVLLAMGCEKAIVDGSLRISLGATTTQAEIDEAVRRISLVVHRLKP